MKVEERNSLIIKILEQAYYDAISGVVLKDSEFDADIFYLFNKVINDKVEKLEAWGFREILIVICVAMKLDPTYEAS